MTVGLEKVLYASCSPSQFNEQSPNIKGKSNDVSPSPKMNNEWKMNDVYPLQIQRERRRGTGKEAGVAHKVVLRNITAERNAKAVIAGAAQEIIKNTGAFTRLLTSPSYIHYLA